MTTPRLSIVSYMQGLTIIAGPNRTGKTTFASAYLSLDREAAHFVNADENSRELAALHLSEAVTNVRAARAMLERIEQLIHANADLVIETTLASSHTPKRSRSGDSAAIMWP